MACFALLNHQSLSLLTPMLLKGILSCCLLFFLMALFTICFVCSFVSCLLLSYALLHAAVPHAALPMLLRLCTLNSLFVFFFRQKKSYPARTHMRLRKQGATEGFLDC